MDETRRGQAIGRLDPDGSYHAVLAEPVPCAGCGRASLMVVHRSAKLRCVSCDEAVATIEAALARQEAGR